MDTKPRAGTALKRANILTWTALILIAGLGRPVGARADSLEKVMVKQSPAVLRYLQEHNYKNVGVLKFRVKKEGEAASDGVGLLNMNLANRLEVALVLASDNDDKKQVGIIRGASTVAAGLAGASHLTKEGRQVLFQGKYPLAWGKQEVAADGFLTGIASLSPDRSEITVGILAFGKDSDKLDKVVQFTAATDPSMLFEGGESFLLRGAFDGGNTVPANKPVPVAAIVKDAGQVKKQEVKYPLHDPVVPVTVRICYDGKAVPFEVRDGKAWVPEPREGQKVTFELKHNGHIQERYAVLLMVNGENTLYKERLSPSLCRKWVVNPGDDSEIVGYKISVDKMETFRVLSRAESKKHEINYGSDVGTIAVAVFREKKWADPPRPQTEEEEDVAALTRGIFPKQPALNLAALKAQLREDGTRALIVPGEEIKVKTRKVKFVEDPTPLMSVTVTYYRP